MSIAEEIERLEAELAQLEDEHRIVLSRIEGARAQLRVLRASRSRDQSDLKGAARTDAIWAVIDAAGGTASRGEILAALTAAGRDDDPRAVSATLTHLVNMKRVDKVSRGVYRALEAGDQSHS